MSGYEWTEQIDALTVTLLRGADLQQVGDVLEFDWESERLVTFDQAFDDLDGDGWDWPVQVEELEGWLVVAEPNGWFLSDEQKLAALSREGVAVSVFFNVNAKFRFIVARQGVVVRSFDPVVPTYEPAGDPLPEEGGLGFGVDEDTTANSFVLLERLTGVRLDESWLTEQPRRTWSAPHPLPPGVERRPEEEQRSRGGVLRRVFRRFR
ncbi:hypothetical protein SAMN05660662_1222 [Blastococcus aurantiacus]|uniref:Uncharacterized protein n=1 Tax=Blastococcus aurantiacus TaxID=1550231 RepID=A0A1G7IZD9_9ACTN|nr:DUF6461 domain-containing protein [Blastococcus aurantiacus]SDF18102.1 hypothetical protein SAMN05660662_1222 [Blastococcus aurantiacus]